MYAWLRGNLFLLFFLTALRFLFLLLFKRYFNSAPFSEISLAFLVGLRFDLMVIGFINLPILLVLKFNFFVRLLPYYFMLCVPIISVMSILDFIYFDLNADRVNHLFLFSGYQLSHTLFFISILALTAYTMSALYRLGRRKNLQAPSFKIYLAVFLFVLLITRGSLGPYHLDLRHSEISENPFVNILCINSPYAWDQALRNRR